MPHSPHVIKDVTVLSCRASVSSSHWVWSPGRSLSQQFYLATASAASCREDTSEVVSCGADSARPSRATKFILARWERRSGPLTYLVSASAGLMAPGTFSRVTSPLRTCCWTHTREVSRCLILPTPNRRDMPMAAVASVFKRRPTSNPRRVRNLDILGEALLQSSMIVYCVLIKKRP